jgi:hypothetical protein
LISTGIFTRVEGEGEGDGDGEGTKRVVLCEDIVMRVTSYDQLRCSVNSIELKLAR